MMIKSFASKLLLTNASKKIAPRKRKWKCYGREKKKKKKKEIKENQIVNKYHQFLSDKHFVFPLALLWPWTSKHCLKVNRHECDLQRRQAEETFAENLSSPFSLFCLAFLQVFAILGQKQQHWLQAKAEERKSKVNEEENNNNNNNNNKKKKKRPSLQ